MSSNHVKRGLFNFCFVILLFVCFRIAHLFCHMEQSRPPNLGLGFLIAKFVTKKFDGWTTLVFGSAKFWNLIQQELDIILGTALNVWLCLDK